MPSFAKRWLALCCAAALLLLTACQKEPWQDLRLFCESYNELAVEDDILLTPEAFELDEPAKEDGQRWQFCIAGDGCRLLTLEALPSGRLHTASLTLHAQEERGIILAQSKRLLGAFTGAPPDQCARWLYALNAGEEETLGFAQLEADGFRFAYAANAAGLYLRVSRLNLLPPESEVPTLREPIRATDAATVATQKETSE